jgi:methionyl-tRNA formyltransferase
MSVYLDAGEMLAQEKLAIDPMETAGELESRLAPLGARLALHVLGQIASGTATGIKQDKVLVTKAPKLTKEHGLINWNRSAEQVCNQIRAMQPWPTAYTYFHRPAHPLLRLIVFKAIPHSGEGSPSAGQIITRADGAAQLLVAGANGCLVKILELQPAGKKRMSAVEFLRGHRLGPGDHFGPEQEE